MNKTIIDRLLKSEEPSIRFKMRMNVFNENPHSPSMIALQQEIKLSNRVQRLLSGRTEDGKLNPISNPYQKWHGAHWVLVHLAEMCFPKGDSSLLPLREQVYDYWLCEKMQRLVECNSESEAARVNGVPVIQGKARRCASQQGNALFSTLALGIADHRAETIVSLLLKWQWPDGGWNCDKSPDAKVSSFYESLIPLRALALYSQSAQGAQSVPDGAIHSSIGKATEVFLTRRMFRGKRDGQVINAEFLKLHYPCYWHYDILFGLKVMSECGLIKDPRCEEALNILESKELPDGGGWPAEGRYYQISAAEDAKPKPNSDKVSWGTNSKKCMNEWVTADALFVLSRAGRISV